MSFAASLFDPVFAAFGTPCVITLADTSEAVTMRGIPAQTTFDEGEVTSVRSTVAVRTTELGSIAQSRLNGSQIQYLGRTARIEFIIDPGAAPDGSGEIKLVLSDL